VEATALKCLWRALMNEDPYLYKRRRAAWISASVVIILLIIFSLVWVFYWRLRAYTDDAYVEGNLVTITPLHSGFVTAIYTDDTFLVDQGQLIVELDQTDAIIALEESENEFADKVREVAQAFHDVFAYRAQVAIKKAELIKAAQDYKHRKEVLAQEAVSLEDFEHALAEVRSAYFSLQWTYALYQKALAFVQGTSLRNHPAVEAAAERLRQRWVDLYRCHIYAPVKGLVAQRKIQVGMWVDAGSPLMSVIPLDQIWINANYKETQMKYMRIGQPARITSDLYGGGTVFHGKIVGLPGGAGNAFSLLPPQNLSGNWIKIVQRLPVRVELDQKELEKAPLRVGLSMEVTVDLSEPGALVPETNTNAPNYLTPIFEEEEKGDCRAIELIFINNLDPSLTSYAFDPLQLSLVDMKSELEEYQKWIEEALADNTKLEKRFNDCGY